MPRCSRLSAATDRRRRRALKLLGAGAAACSLPLAALPRMEHYPFRLGVASGYPQADGIALWTRLAPQPLAPNGGMPAVELPVRWEISEDAHFGRIADAGTAWALPEWGHSVHAESIRLRPHSQYFYRFVFGDAVSPTGRTSTAPGWNASPDRLRFGVASCQQYEHGYFAAYRHMLDDDLDFIVHLGDYIYESSWGDAKVRRHAREEPVTASDYRAHYGQYRSDPDLQAAHAACPWVMVWDDHEVDNDYSSARSQDDDVADWFLRRRAAAYHAYYEHMPLRRQMLPLGPHLQLYRRARFGRLATLHLLDGRQYRSAQPCPRPARSGGTLVSAATCKERLDPAATMLGRRQEGWLAAGLEASDARWNVLGQQTVMTDAGSDPGDGRVYWSDAWDGYPAARERLLRHLAEASISNPVVLSGDVHSFWANALKVDFADEAAPAVATEFVTTSITSRPPPEERLQAVQRSAAHVDLATGAKRGYTRIELTPDAMTVDMQGLADARRPDSACETFARYRLEAGRPGPVRA